MKPRAPQKWQQKTGGCSMGRRRATLVQQARRSPEPDDLDLSNIARPFPGASFDVVAMAASAGGIAVLGRAVADLPADFLAAVVVVQHLDPRHRSLRAVMLRRRPERVVVEVREAVRLVPR